jgi:predicted MFS family arabinose efflux permease
MGVLLGFLGSSSTFVLALLCAALLGAAANLPEPMYWTSYAARVDERDSSAFYGLVESSITGGFACGGIILGAVVVPLGISTGTWTMGLAGTVLASAAFVPALRHRREQTGTAPVAAKAGS